MKILFVMSHVGVFRHFDGVVRRLCHRGHIVKIVYRRGSKPGKTDRALLACQAETNRCESQYLLLRRGPWWWLLWMVRELLNYATYLRPQHPSPALAKRWESRLPLPRPAGIVVRLLLVRKLFASDKVQRAMRQVETLTPPDPAIARWLVDNQPDVVVASPFIFHPWGGVEYIKAARALQIPTVVAVASWDNLTTKGTFHIIPDLTLVWNQGLLEEAVKLHDVPSQKLFVTGAPSFDSWFEMQPSLDRASFGKQVGIEPDRPFVVYLGSSTSIAGDETPFVQEFARSLLEHPDTKDIAVLVRPHPLNAAIWNGFSAENVTIWPPGGDVPDSPESKQDYYNTLFHSTAVVGVNTTALLEAAIVDRPCVTIMTEQYRQTQWGMGHFHHLLDADFLEIAHSFSESAAVLAAILHGVDSKADNRRRFVREFIRPWGIEKSASCIMAKAIEVVASKQNTNQDEICHLVQRSLHQNVT